MKLFLASSLDKTAALLKPLLPTINPKIIFISNAADMHKGDKWWVESDRKALKQIGYSLIEIDLREMTESKFSDILKHADAVHFCGGSVLYLIGLIKEKKFVNLIINFVKNGGLYTRTSAGSMIVTTDLMLNTADPEEKVYLNVNNWIYDNQVVWVQDDKFEILSVKN